MRFCTHKNWIPFGIVQQIVCLARKNPFVLRYKPSELHRWLLTRWDNTERALFCPFWNGNGWPFRKMLSMPVDFYSSKEVFFYFGKYYQVNLRFFSKLQIHGIYHRKKMAKSLRYHKKRNGKRIKRNILLQALFRVCFRLRVRDNLLL